MRCLRVLLVAALVIGGGAAPAVAATEPTPPPPGTATSPQDVERSTRVLVASLDARLADLGERVEALRADVARAVEAYDGARVRLAAADQAAEAASARLHQAQRRVRDAEDALAAYAAAVYRSGGPLAPVGTLFDSGGVQSFANRLDLLDRVGDAEAKIIKELLDAQAAGAAARDAARAAVRTAQAALAQVTAARDAATERLAQAEATLADFDRQREDLLAALAAARESTIEAEAARAQARALAAARAGTPFALIDLAERDGAVTPAAARAIAFAQAQLGKPYEWAADGPQTFDCSGLTMRAWQAGGVSLPHYSVAQWQRSRPVDLADIRPGDLVFFADDTSNPATIYHVGLYVGRGLMIEAPYTGAVVRVSPIWRPSLLGAARPTPG
ncbi:MAG TPA: C40 family peptidase [Actinomycetes bacterium]|nr:C40 family peptidase [Actinomycetes bacterium]